MFDKSEIVIDLCDCFWVRFSRANSNIFDSTFEIIFDAVSDPNVSTGVDKHKLINPAADGLNLCFLGI